MGTDKTNVDVMLFGYLYVYIYVCMIPCVSVVVYMCLLFVGASGRHIVDGHVFVCLCMFVCMLEHARI